MKEPSAIDPAVVTAVRQFANDAADHGIHFSQAVLFGSQARGEAHEWSDIDLLVIAPELDDRKDRSLIHELWHISGRIDSRIEPIACGDREWIEDDGSPILEIARREGIVVFP